MFLNTLQSLSCILNSLIYEFITLLTEFPEVGALHSISNVQKHHWWTFVLYISLQANDALRLSFVPQCRRWHSVKLGPMSSGQPPRQMYRQNEICFKNPDPDKLQNSQHREMSVIYWHLSLGTKITVKSIVMKFDNQGREIPGPCEQQVPCRRNQLGYASWYMLYWLKFKVVLSYNFPLHSLHFIKITLYQVLEVHEFLKVAPFTSKISALKLCLPMLS